MIHEDETWIYTKENFEIAEYETNKIYQSLLIINQWNKCCEEKTFHFQSAIFEQLSLFIG